MDSKNQLKYFAQKEQNKAAINPKIHNPKIFKEIQNPWKLYIKTTNKESIVKVINKNKVITPKIAETQPYMNIWKMFFKRYIEHPDDICQEIYDVQSGKWEPMKVREFFEKICKCAKGFIALGIKKGTKVCIMSKTRYEWGLFDMALLSIGAVIVPIYQTASSELAKHIINNSGTKFAICENEKYAQIILKKNKQLRRKRLFIIDKGLINYLIKIGKNIKNIELEKKCNTVKAKNLATIIYTSGTTSKPKGVKLTHANIINMYLNIFLDFSISEIVPIINSQKKRTLMFLPLAHGYARTVQIFIYFSNSIIGHCPDTKLIIQYCRSFKPTLLVVVPRVLEKIYNKARMSASSKLKSIIFRNAVEYARQVSKKLSNDENSYDDVRINKDVSANKPPYYLFNALVYKKIKKLMGGNLKYFISGGAPLDQKLLHFYRGMGIVLLDGYGLTETTAIITINRPNTMHIGATGAPLPGSEIIIAKDGEILIKSIHLFDGYKGYLKISSTNSKGYFKTGDIGRFDSKGRLYINGRKKEIIITSGGKNVTPSELEDKLSSHPLISNILVVGEQKPFISALITLDKDMLYNWLKLKKLNTRMTINEARTNEKVLTSLKAAIEKVNKTTTRAESIRKIFILNVDWTEKDGYITTTQKLRRKKIEKDFSTEIDELYSDYKNKAIINI